MEQNRNHPSCARRICLRVERTWILFVCVFAVHFAHTPGTDKRSNANWCKSHTHQQNPSNEFKNTHQIARSVFAPCDRLAICMSLLLFYCTIPLPPQRVSFFCVRPDFVKITKWPQCATKQFHTKNVGVIVDVASSFMSVCIWLFMCHTHPCARVRLKNWIWLDAENKKKSLFCGVHKCVCVGVCVVHRIYTPSPTEFCLPACHMLNEMHRKIYMMEFLAINF